MACAVWTGLGLVGLLTVLLLDGLVLGADVGCDLGTCESNEPITLSHKKRPVNCLFVETAIEYVYINTVFMQNQSILCVSIIYNSLVLKQALSFTTSH